MNYEWFVSNNSVSTATDLFYTIYNEGIYPITLSATSTFGCENDTTFNLYVYPIPEAPLFLQPHRYARGMPSPLTQRQSRIVR